MENEIEYPISPNKDDYFKFERPRFQAKEEYTKVEFDPNLRLRIPTMPYDVMHRYLRNYDPIPDPQSTYVAVNH